MQHSQHGNNSWFLPRVNSIRCLPWLEPDQDRKIELAVFTAKMSKICSELTPLWDEALARPGPRLIKDCPDQCFACRRADSVPGNTDAFHESGAGTTPEAPPVGHTSFCDSGTSHEGLPDNLFVLKKFFGCYYAPPYKLDG
jgi:hypothetical protein